MDNGTYTYLSSVLNEFEIDVIYGCTDYKKTKITSESVDRPGLQFIGYYDHFDATRLKIIGNMEYYFLDKMTSEERLVCFDKMFEYPIPALVFARGFNPFPECIEMAKKHDRTILSTKEETSSFISTLTSMLKSFLSPKITRHGVLMEVYGEGVLLLGESGVGKSETAIELIKRGHRLVADDAVEIVRTAKDMLRGTAPELIRYYMELRGIGVIDVRQLFGMGAVRDNSPVDLIINIELWKDGVNYDRIGLEEQFTSILDVPIPTITVPVKPGRNLAVIIEVAAMNNRTKRMGFNAAEEFTKQINAHFEAEQAIW